MLTGQPCATCLRGNTVSDAPLIIGSLDPCYSCTDRVTVVDAQTQSENRRL